MFATKSPEKTAAALIVILVGAVILFFALRHPAVAPSAGTAMPPTAQQPIVPELVGPPPSDADYQRVTHDLMAPFFSVAANVQPADFAAPPAELGTLVAKTQEALMGARVPKEFRDQHLSLVLLLDQWKRSLAGSAADQRAVLSHTAEVRVAQPWLQ